MIPELKKSSEELQYNIIKSARKYSDREVEQWAEKQKDKTPETDAEIKARKKKDTRNFAILLVVVAAIVIGAIASCL